jgi:hypothetical protein
VEITPERLQMALPAMSIITLVFLSYVALILWRKMSELLRTAYIGLMLLSSRKRYELEVDDRLSLYATAGSLRPQRQRLSPGTLAPETASRQIPGHRRQ